MIAFNYVEDYIEYIAGYRNIAGQLSNNWFSAVYYPTISLARYDVKIINSLATQTLQGTALTDRQAELAVKIVVKYQRQLGSQGIAVNFGDSPNFRLLIRQVDRSSCAWLDEKIYLQFPYNSDIIDHIKRERTSACGSIKFNKDLRVWVLSPTEHNINLAFQLAHQYHFQIDDSLHVAMTAILEVEKQDYKIELGKNSKGFFISNAPAPLITHIEQCNGGLGLGNFAKLVDCSSVLGYQIESSLEQQAIVEFGTLTTQLMLNKDSRLAIPTATSLAVIDKIFVSLVAYAELCDRWPVFIYEPVPHEVNFDLKGLLKKHVPADQIIWAEKVKQLKKVDKDKKFVYISKKISITEELRVPLLISTIGMYFGGQKQLLLQQAEKVVYFTAEVYNKMDRPAAEMTINLENLI